MSTKYTQKQTPISLTDEASAKNYILSENP